MTLKDKQTELRKEIDETKPSLERALRVALLNYVLETGLKVTDIRYDYVYEVFGGLVDICVNVKVEGE